MRAKEVMRKVILFEPEDFEGCGQMLIRNSSTPGSKDKVFAVTVAYKVGYIPGRRGNEYVLVSLVDGMIGRRFKKLELLCKHLNEDCCGYRPMTADEIKSVLGAQGNRFG